MATAPYGVRLLVGAATVAVEETRRLPQTILTYPMTLMSQAAHVVMKWQQGLADLVIKGDSTLDVLFPPKDEQPAWAQFDEDLDTGENSAGQPTDPEPGAADAGHRAEGRFALYSFDESAGSPPTETPTTPIPTRGAGTPVPPPEIAVELDYASLTLAQLRARLRSLGVDELEALLSYEETTTARPPFQTLLANRITRATTK